MNDNMLRLDHQDFQFPTLAFQTISSISIIINLDNLKWMVSLLRYLPLTWASTPIISTSPGNAQIPRSLQMKAW